MEKYLETNERMTTQHNNNRQINMNNSIVPGQFISNSFTQQSTQLRRMTSTSSDSGDSGVDPSYRQERKIFVGGVPSSVGPEELAQFFQSYGQVEEAFIIYDRFSGRHRGFGFVTFGDMNVTKSVCSIRVFNLHGRKIECKRALKREEILGFHENHSNELKYFRPNDGERVSTSTSFIPNSLSSNMLSCPIQSSFPYDQHRQTSSNIIHTNAANWLLNSPYQTMTSFYHPTLNGQQQYAIVSLPGYSWNDFYRHPTMFQAPWIQEIIVPGGSTTIAVPSMINL